MYIWFHISYSSLLTKEIQICVFCNGMYMGSIWIMAQSLCWIDFSLGNSTVLVSEWWRWFSWIVLLPFTMNSWDVCEIVDVVVVIGIDIAGFALLEFRIRITSDPHGALLNWNPNDSNPCKWLGVHCVDGKVQML